jgi:hypothetical protein
MKLVQPGGCREMNTLIMEYQTAVNNGDEDLYLSLVPRCERNSFEKEYVSDKLDDLSGHKYEMSVDNYYSLGPDATGEVMGSLFVLNPINSPIVTEVYDVDVKVEDEDGKVNTIELNVLYINKKYFINDVEFY